MFQKECDTSYVGFTVDGAKWLVENTDIKLVGKAYIVFLYLSCFSPRAFFFSNHLSQLPFQLARSSFSHVNFYTLNCFLSLWLHRCFLHIMQGIKFLFFLSWITIISFLNEEAP